MATRGSRYRSRVELIRPVGARATMYATINGPTSAARSGHARARGADGPAIARPRLRLESETSRHVRPAIVASVRKKRTLFGRPISGQIGFKRRIMGHVLYNPCWLSMLPNRTTNVTSH